MAELKESQLFFCCILLNMCCTNSCFKSKFETSALPTSGRF